MNNMQKEFLAFNEASRCLGVDKLNNVLVLLAGVVAEKFIDGPKPDIQGGDDNVTAVQNTDYISSRAEPVKANARNVNK